MTTSQLVFILIVTVVSIPIAYVMERNKWGKRSREDLLRRIRSKDWQKIYPALKELKRRKEDLTPYLPEMLALLVSDSAMKRSAGKIALNDFLPEIAREFSGFQATAKPAERAAFLAPLLAKYGGAAKPAP